MTDSALTVTHLSPEIQATRRTIPAAAAPGSELRISLDQSLPAAVELLERTMVKSALDRSKGHLEEAAKLLEAKAFTLLENVTRGRAEELLSRLQRERVTARVVKQS